MGGNKALNRLAYMVQEEKMTNLELKGCVWLYAWPRKLETRPLSLEPEWIRAPLPGDFFQVFGILGLSFAGIPCPDAGLLEKNSVCALTPKAADDLLFKDWIRCVKGVWWMEQGLRSALWELDAAGLGPFEVVI
jgi:hypothetical protein